MSTNDLQIIRGDDVDIQVTFKNSEGEVIDITGSTVFFTVKKRLADTDEQAYISKNVTSHSNPTEGIAIVKLNASDTNITPGKYHYDVQVRLASGSISSSVRGLIEVIKDVTIRTS
jgi:hypothetical protein